MFVSQTKCWHPSPLPSQTSFLGFPRFKSGDSISLATQARIPGVTLGSRSFSQTPIWSDIWPHVQDELTMKCAFTDVVPYTTKTILGCTDGNWLVKIRGVSDPGLTTHFHLFHKHLRKALHGKGTILGAWGPAVNKAGGAMNLRRGKGWRTDSCGY